MKQLQFLFLLFITSSSIAQNGERALGIQAGYDFFSSKEHGWNVGVFGQFRFNENSKWYHEYGIAYSEREYNRSEEVVFDTSIIEYYATLPFGGFQAAELYRKEKMIRFQAGIGVDVFEKEDHKLAVGMDLGATWSLGRRAHGEYLSARYEYTDTSTTYVGASVQAYSNNRSSVQSYSLLEFLPYLNYTVKINEAFSFNTRMTGVYPLFTIPKRKLQGQLNLGVYYSF